jgi:hypothetical protein
VEAVVMALDVNHAGPVSVSDAGPRTGS